MIGVVTMPPSAPRLVMVIVEPVSSSRVALPVARRRGEPGDLGGACPQVERLGVPDHRHHQAASVCVAMPRCTALVALDDAVVVVVAGVHLRERRQPRARAPA